MTYSTSSASQQNTSEPPPFDAANLEFAPSGYPFLYAVVPVMLHSWYATPDEVAEGLKRYENRVPGLAGPQVLPLYARSAARASLQGKFSGAGLWLYDEHPELEAEAWSFGAPVTIQLTDAAAAAWISAHESNPKCHCCDCDYGSCWHCGETVVYVSIPYDTAPSSHRWVEDDDRPNIRMIFIGCHDQGLSALRARLAPRAAVK